MAEVAIPRTLFVNILRLIDGLRPAPLPVSRVPEGNPTIREKFNTYRFVDHKERVINLLARVTSVSVRTVNIVEATLILAPS